MRASAHNSKINDSERFVCFQCLPDCPASFVVNVVECSGGKNGRNEMKRSPFAAFSLCITERLRSVTEVFVRNASAIALPPSPQILLSVNGGEKKRL